VQGKRPGRRDRHAGARCRRGGVGDDGGAEENGKQGTAAGHGGRITWIMLGTMSLVERINQDLKASMKAQDAPRTSVLRMAKAALMNREIDKKSALTDDEAVKVLQGLVRQREDSVFQFRKASRPELVRKEEAEIEVLKGYLPAEATDEDIEAAVKKAVAETGASSAKEMGRVMKAALAALQAAGRPADGKKVNEAVRRRLGN
jgi:uncharacterized protein